MKCLANRFVLFVVGLFGGLTPHLAVGQEWTRFRGPNGTGESETTTIPAVWTSDDYNWKIKLPGNGHSSPVLWGKRLFILSADPETATRFVLCYDSTTGKPIWERKFESAPHHLHKQSSFASSTPAVDEQRVYVAWSTPAKTTLMALNHDGDPLWDRDLGTWASQHGFGTSPMIIDDMVVVSKSQEAKDGPTELSAVPESFMMAFDKKTGDERWRTPRQTINVAYSVPAVFQPKNGPKQLVCTSSGEGIFSLNPNNGEELWSDAVFDKRTVSSPLVKGDMILGSTGSGGGGNYLVAVRSDGGKPTLAYKIANQAPYVPTAVARGNLLFMVADNGMASCLDISTGDVHWRERIGGNYSSSLVRAGDKVICVSMDGEVVIFAAEEKAYQELGRVDLGEGSRSTPAIANGCLYLRTFSHLMSIGPAQPVRPR